MAREDWIYRRWIDYCPRDLYNDLQWLPNPEETMVQVIRGKIQPWINQIHTEEYEELRKEDRSFIDGLAEAAIYDWAITQIPASFINALETVPECLAPSIALMKSLDPVPAGMIIHDWKVYKWKEKEGKV